MFDIDLWREIFQSINKNRLRTLMSGFTVLFAIMLFTILFGIANGLQNTFTEAFGDDATNAIFIRSGTTSKASNGLKLDGVFNLIIIRLAVLNLKMMIILNT